MKLVAIGDSFVEGLIKKPKENTSEERKQINFVTKLFQKSDFFDSYENLGVRGQGNDYIVHQAYNLMKDSANGDMFVLIVLSGLERQSVYNPIKKTYTHYSTRKSFIEPVYHVNILMSGIHNLLRKSNIPHMFTHSFTPFYLFYNGFGINHHNIIGNVNAANSLFDIIAGRWNTTHLKLKDPLLSHCDFKIKKNKYIAPCLHPSAKGHELIADYLQFYVEDYLKDYHNASLPS